MHPTCATYICLSQTVFHYKTQWKTILAHSNAVAIDAYNASDGARGMNYFEFRSGFVVSGAENLEREHDSAAQTLAPATFQKSDIAHNCRRCGSGECKKHKFNKVQK